MRCIERQQVDADADADAYADADADFGIPVLPPTMVEYTDADDFTVVKTSLDESNLPIR